MAWAREPMYAANTNPEVVAEVVKLCYRAGAKEVYVTDNPCDNARTVFNLSQIPLFAQKENAEVFIPQSRHYENMNIGGTFLIEWPVLALFKKVDKVINFILLTLVLGRFFCGWVCPFGTMHHFFSFIFEKIGLYKKDNSLQNFYKWKYYILFFILFGAILGVNLSGYFDPLSIIVKGFGIFLLPVVSLLYKYQFLPYGIKDILFYYILGREEFYYSQAFMVGLFFFDIINIEFL